MTLRVAVVGAGRVGSRRVLEATRAGDRVVVVADTNRRAAADAARACGAKTTTDWQRALEGVDVVVVSTVPSAAAAIVVAALEAGNHVLCEKPFGRDLDEASRMAAACEAAGRILKVGLNHRHHPGVRRVHALVSSGRIGALLALRAAYGHGGRAGYEREWRADAATAGGGELLDQGFHLVDLARWFLGDVVEAFGMLSTAFWPIQPLEDNAFAVLRTGSGAVASLHASWTQWRNLFRLELIGRDGYAIVEGLGGSYGAERLVWARRRADHSAPEEFAESFSEDDSWADEWRELRDAIAAGRAPLGDARDGLAAARAVRALYASAALRRSVALAEVA